MIFVKLKCFSVSKLDERRSAAAAAGSSSILQFVQKKQPDASAQTEPAADGAARTRGDSPMESDDARQKVENIRGSVHSPPPPVVAPVGQEPDIDPEFLAALPEDIR
jgi:hypothetical protein